MPMTAETFASAVIVIACIYTLATGSHSEVSLLLGVGRPFAHLVEQAAHTLCAHFQQQFMHQAATQSTTAHGGEEAGEPALEGDSQV
jgi:hypothetical protein